MLYAGRFVKGILFTQGAELLIERFPWLQELFHVFAYSMWSSIPQSPRADGLFTSYPNPVREAWFRAKYPERAHQVMVPAYGRQKAAGAGRFPIIGIIRNPKLPWEPRETVL